MKKILSLLLVFTMVFSLVILSSCSKKDEEKTSASASADKKTEQAEQTEQTEQNVNTGEKQTPAPSKQDEPTSAKEPSDKEPTDFSSGAEHLKYVADKAVKSAGDAAISAYTVVTEAKASRTTYDLSLTIGDALKQLIAALASGNEKQIDLSFFKSIGITLVDNNKDDLRTDDVTLKLNGTELFNGVLQFDKAEGSLSFYIASLGLGLALGKEDQAALFERLGPSVSLPEGTKITDLINEVKKNLPSGETVKTIIDRYLSIVFNSIKNVVSAEEEVVIGDVKDVRTVLKTTISADELIEIFKNVFTALKSDGDVKKIIENVSASIPVKGEGEEEQKDPYDAFTKYLDKTLESIDATTEEKKAKLPTFSVKVCIDGNNAVSALFVDVTADGKTGEFVFGRLEKDGKYASEFSAKIPNGEGFTTASLKSAGEVRNGKTTGTIAFSVDGSALINVKIDGLDKEALKRGSFIGKISFNLGEVVNALNKMRGQREQLEPDDPEGGIDPMAGISAIATGMSVTVEGSETAFGKQFAFKLANVGGEALLTAKLEITKSEPVDVQKSPANMTLDEFKSNFKPEEFIASLSAKLKEAGVPEDLLKLLSSFITVETVEVYEDDED